MNKNNPPKILCGIFLKIKKISKKLTVILMKVTNGKNPTLNLNNNVLSINFREKFLPRRGRVNCSLNDNGKWRWFGTQFIITKN